MPYTSSIRVNNHHPRVVVVDSNLTSGTVNGGRSPEDIANVVIFLVKTNKRVIIKDVIVDNMGV